MITQAQLIGDLREKQAKDLLKRGLKVQARARVLLSGSAGHPKRVNTGLLRSSVQVQLRSFAGHPAVRVGTNVRYSGWVHDGTGIYGPRHKPITPVTKKALKFRGRSGVVIVRSVKGMKPNHFLVDALSASNL